MSEGYTTAAASPLDAALKAAVGSRLYQHALELVLGVSLFGGSVFVWVVPMLFDAHISADTGIAPTSLVASSSLIYFGWIGGCCVLSPWGDRVGRKPALVVSGLLAASGALLTAAAGLHHANPGRSMALVLAGRAVGGFALGGLMPQALALAVEASETAQATAVGMLLNVYYCGAVALLAGYHYSISAARLPWAMEITGLGAFLGLATAGVAACAVESPSFLLSAGRAEAAAASLRRIASINGAGDEAADLIAAVVRLQSDSPPSPLGPVSAPEGLCRRAWLRRNACVGVAFFAVAASWFGLNLSAGALASEAMLSLLLLTLVDVPAYAVGGWLAERYGLRHTAAGAFAVGGAILASLAYLASHAFSQPAITAAALAGKFCISGAFGLLWVLPAEMYPAHCLGAALGFANVCGRSGSMLAPVATAALPLWGTAAACCAVSLAGAAALAAIE